MEVIAEQGVAGATHRSIAARAGMPTSTTSYFFSSLDDLVAAALQVVGDRIVARVDGVTASVADAQLTPREAIDRFVDAVLAEPERDTVAQFEIYLECARRPQLQATAHQIMASIERGRRPFQGPYGSEPECRRAGEREASSESLVAQPRADRGSAARIEGDEGIEKARP